MRVMHECVKHTRSAHGESETEREIERDRETGNKRERHQLVNLFDPAVVIEHLFWFSAQVV